MILLRPRNSIWNCDPVIYYNLRTHMKNVLLACLLGAALTAPAYSQTITPVQADVPRPYMGLGVTTSRNIYDDGTKASLKLFGGYDFNRTWGVEAGHIGKSDFASHTFVYDGTTYNLIPTTMRSTSNYLAGKATMAVIDKFSIVTKLGVAASRGEELVAAGSNIYNSGSRSTKYGLYAAIGVKYQLSEKVAVSLDLERRGRPTSSGHRPEAASVNVAFGF